MPATTIGTGSSITFATSGFTAHVMDIDWTGIEREAVDSSHMQTTVARTFIPGKLYNPGEIQLEIAFDGDDAPPLNAAPEQITVEFAKKDPASTTGATWQSTGFVTGFEVNAPLEDKMTATMTIKCSGAITMTDEA